jgi:hypothetical protein
MRAAMSRLSDFLDTGRSTRREALLTGTMADAVEESPAVAAAKRMLAVLHQEGPVGLDRLDELAAAIGTIDAEDPGFKSALRLVSDDDRVSIVSEDNKDHLAPTTAALLESRLLERKPDTTLVENTAIAHLRAAGLADGDAIAKAARLSGSSDPYFKLAMTRLIEAGQAEWYGENTYGVPRAELSSALADRRQQQRNVRASLGDLWKSGQALSLGLKALSDVRRAPGLTFPTAHMTEAAPVEPWPDVLPQLDEHVSAPTESLQSANDALEQIRTLGQLRDAGILTSEEFEIKKREMLART